MSSSQLAPARKLSLSLIAVFAILLCAIAVVLVWHHQVSHELVASDKLDRLHKEQFIAFSVLMSLVVIAFVFMLYTIRKTLQSQEQAILQQANYDAVTGLPNRRLFSEYLKLAIAQSKRKGKLVAIVRLNINRFSQINTGVGHEAADELLRQYAIRISQHVRASDTVARMGADDFAMIISEFDRKDELEVIVQRVLDEVAESYSIESHILNIHTSAGIAVYPIDQDDGGALLLSADSAMAQAKDIRGGGYIFFTSEMGVNSTARLQEEQSLRKALQNNEFILHYQPKVDSTMGSVNGFEALIRWQHPERGLVPPGLFIPVLEESGLIIPVGEWVIRETCEAISRWSSQGLSVVPVSVNVAAPQFNQKGFVQRVKDILDETGVEPAYIELEITESCLMSDAEANIEIVRELKELGMSIAVDDFGTGYSSLNHLNRFPIDTLKIDRSFITNVNNRRENDNAGIVTAIMSLSHSLRLNVVAEGVETAQELAFLYALGCRTIQGFLFSKPLAEADVIALLKDAKSINDALLAARQELSA